MFEKKRRMRNHKYSQASLEAFIKTKEKKRKKKGEKRMRYVIKR
jgi:hypothetical protein